MIYLLQNLIAKLTMPERFLASILPVTPAEMPPEVESRLKTQIEQFEMLFSNTEDVSEELVEKWTELLEMIWLKNCSLCKDNLKKKVEEQEPKKQIKQHKPILQTMEVSMKTPTLQFPELELAQPDETILKAVIPSSFPIYKYKPRNQTIYHAEENFPKSNEDRNLSKTALRVKMQNAFYDLVIYDENDLEGLAAMLRIISLCSKLGEPYARDPGLRYDFFEYAKCKMPVKMSQRVRVLKEVGGRRSVSRLFNELRDYIIEEAGNRRTEMETELCLNCFKTDGHSKKDCPNEALPRAKIG